MRLALILGTLAFLGSVGCRVLDRSAPPPAVQLLPGQTDAVFTTARPTFAAALAEFFDRRPEPEQPFDFPHNIHAEKQIACTEYCHESVSTGPEAGLPSVLQCLACHRNVAVDRPRIRQITGMYERGEDFMWQRVYGYQPSAHVKFNHAPHIRANVECTTCHGDIAAGTVAKRNVDLDMGFCVNCHNERQASIDCLTCHF